MAPIEDVLAELGERVAYVDPVDPGMAVAAAENHLNAVRICIDDGASEQAAEHWKALATISARQLVG